jgi:ABC-type multidrug transport system fused ATPase/permease subunit
MAYVQEIDRDLWTPYIFKLTVRDSALAIARAGIIATAGHLAYQGKMGVGSMVVVWSWLNMATGDLYMTGGLYRRMITHIAAIDRFLKMFNVTTDTPESDNPCIPERPKGAIAVHDVSFSYPSKPSPEEADTIETEQEEQEPEDHTIQGINLRIAAGQRVAIVGKSGSGKTTIARLLARAFDPHRGSVESDGAGLPQTSLQWLRENIGVVDQRVGIFDQTLRYNLLCALSDRQRSEVTEARIKQVMRDCAVDEFLGDLPMGLDTVLGESGNRLSGGQAQRVALARIMLKDPLILILDEATSSLDAETEEYIRANLDRARQGRTTIIIAHRFSTIRKAESVIVVDDGKIVDTGTHRELWSRCPAYQRLVQNQILALQDLVA